jgi:hypothetical protein
MAHNVQHSIENNQLVIRVDLSDEAKSSAPLSDRGNAIIASSTQGRGWMKVPDAMDGYAVSMNLCVVAKLARR